MNTLHNDFAGYPAVRNQWEELALGSASAYRRDAPDFLQQRIAELTAATPQSGRIDMLSGNFQQFLGPNTALRPHAEGRGFVLDDMTLYKHAVRALPGYRNKQLGDFAEGADLYSTAVLGATQDAVERYFGEPPDGPGMDRRYHFLTRHLRNPAYSSANVSISALRKLAACTERTAGTNDTMHVFGYAPVFERGYLGVDEEEDVLHAFLVTLDNDGLYLYDPTNPHYVVGRKQRVVEYQPAIYHINDLITEERSVTVGGLRHVYERVGTTMTSVFQSRMTYSTDSEGQPLQPR